MRIDTPTPNIRILLAEDHKIVREGIYYLLEREPDLEVVGQADDGRAAIDKVTKLMPDIALIDMKMPELNGIEVTRQISTIAPHCKVIILSMYSDKRFVTQALNAGAKGYLLKGCASDELVHAVRTVHDNSLYICPKITEVIVDNYVKTSPVETTGSTPELSPREKEVLQLIADGKNTKEIAAILNIGTKTVETYRQQLMKKLKIFNIAILTKYAVREGLSNIDI